ncbi:hypothetical protein HU200_029395 [Digitaria exilis]|uniref:Uncharacterized protein n=1 Tax=Digitaria exilis TaxID=1010633 RepID=A0A835BUM0_9POAL|nr:hypothetical protein HU200_029395 [Digitaria exilis]CAB3489517.1 unnamed protein product [Digitaria exilis]
MPSAAAMPRPSSSASRPRKPSPSRSASPATAPKPEATGSSARRRSPLSDLNSRDPSATCERPGCFRFLRPSSSSSSAAASGARSASTPRTPKRPDPKPRLGGRRHDHRLPDQESRTRAERCAAEKPRRRGPEPIGGGRIKKAADQGAAAGGKKPQWPAARRVEELEALTPEKKAGSGSTPSSSTGVTPPVHASISPEVVAACGSATPACFAAGHHVLPGVGDRRKCRPRGILAIAGEEEGFASEDLEGAEPSRASIRWLSSPSGPEAGTCSTKCGNGEEASVNWLVSPRDGGVVDPLEDEIFVPRRSSDDAFWRFSPDCTGLLGSPLLGGLLDFGTPLSDMSGTTPSSGFLPVEKTPSSGDSISPFSLIVKRASESSARLCGLGSSYQSGSGSNSAADATRVSGEAWSGSVSNGTRSGLTRTGSRPMKMMDPVLECLEMMSLSPMPGDDDYNGSSVLPAPVPELSFQFAGAPMLLESVDLTSFKRSPRDIEFKGKETGFQKPVMTETRISWREGLVSRMFDIGDLDCCKWLSDDEDSPVLSHNDEALPHGTNSQPGGDQLQTCGFGSVEFSCFGDGLSNDRSKALPNPVSVAESMRAEGFELISSDDSDWTLFYKNNLFES